MTDLMCSRGACKAAIKTGEPYYSIANQPEYAPPNNCRPYCRECGRKITDYATEAGTGLKWERKIHSDPATGEATGPCGNVEQANA